MLFTVFVDDFNRSDGAAGNGWLESTGNFGAAPSIVAGRLTANSGSAAGVYRPLPAALPLRVQATISPNPNGRYAEWFGVSDSTGNQTGALISVNRADSVVQNSAIGYSESGLKFSTFQFTGELSLDFTINTDGSVDGSVSNLSSSFAFDFGPASLAFTPAFFHIGYDAVQGSIDSLILSSLNDTPPTATLAAPPNGATIAAAALNDLDYLDVRFSDDAGIDGSTITDLDAEFMLGGTAADAVTVASIVVPVDESTYRYFFVGDFEDGLVTVTFPADAWEDLAGNGNAEVTESFTVGTVDPELAVRSDNSGAVFRHLHIARGGGEIFQSHPVGANLEVHNNLALWMSVQTTTSGAAAAAAEEGFARMNVIPPEGDVTYKASFAHAGDQVSVSMSMDIAAPGGSVAALLNVLDLVLPMKGIPVTPEAVASLVGHLSELPSLTSAAQNFSQLGKAVLAPLWIANDLREFATDEQQIAAFKLGIRNVLESFEVKTKDINKLLGTDLDKALHFLADLLTVTDLIKKLISVAVIDFAAAGAPAVVRFTAYERPSAAAAPVSSVKVLMSETATRLFDLREWPDAEELAGIY